jgi:CheY-like chemotaxis protein
MSRESYGLTKIELKLRIGEMLLDADVIDQDQLAAALAEQEERAAKGERVLLGNIICSQQGISKKEIENIFARYLIFTILQLFQEILRNDAYLSERLGSAQHILDRVNILIPKWKLKTENGKEVIDAEIALVITPEQNRPVTINVPFTYVVEDQVASIDLPGAVETVKAELQREKKSEPGSDLSRLGIFLPPSDGQEKILYVDDETDQRELMERLLEKLGYTVKTAASAEEALNMVENEDFRLIITDLQMPEMDGTQLCEKIKASCSGCVVYALSGYIASFGESIEEAGFDGYLSKPVGMDVLKSAVEGAFDKINDEKGNLA